MKGIHAASKFGLICLGLIVLLAGTQALAQLPTGTILGVVKDSTDRSVPSATVTVTNKDTGASRAFTTGDDGSYRFPALPAGNYEIKVSGEGFATTEQTGIILAVGQDEVLNFKLQVGAVSERVEVTGAAPLVDTTTSSLGGLVTEEKIEDLPLNGRNYTDLILLQPGVTQQTDEQTGTPGSVFSSNGESTRSNNYLLDGTITQNAFGFSPTSVSGSSLGLDGIQEYRVVTNMSRTLSHLAHVELLTPKLEDSVSFFTNTLINARQIQFALRVAF